MSNVGIWKTMNMVVMHNSHLKRLRRCLFFADPELINGWKVYTSKRSSCLNDRRFRIKWFFLIHCCCQCRYLFTPLRYLPKEGHKDRLLHDKQNKNLHTLFVNAEQSQRRKCDEGSDILLASIDCASVSQTEVWRYFAPTSVGLWPGWFFRIF